LEAVRQRKLAAAKRGSV
jgi:CheY-like chemotaxis protein